MGALDGPCLRVALKERLNGTPQAGLTWQEGPRWRVSARPSWRRLTRPKGDSGGNARTSDQPMPRVPSTAGGCVALSRRHVDGRERTACRDEPAGGRIISALTIPARPPSSQSTASPAQVAQPVLARAARCCVGGAGGGVRAGDAEQRLVG